MRTIYVTAEQMSALMPVENPSHQTVRSVSRIEWREQAFKHLREWLETSEDRPKTIKTWAAVYIRCGKCVQDFAAWCDKNKISSEVDLPEWVESVTQEIRKNGWV